MRRFFVASCVAAGVLGVVQVISLWQVAWHSAGRGSQVVVGQGCVRLWVGQPGDFPAAWPGLSAGGWTGGAMMWRPEFESRARLWVIPPPAPGGAPPVARRISGLSIVLPVYLALLPAALTAGGCGLMIKRRRRIAAARGLCRKCGYDTSGLRGRCPECGTPVFMWRAWLGRLARRSPWGAGYFGRNSAILLVPGFGGAMVPPD